MESSGKPFSGLAHTLDVTRDGARLGGVRNFLKIGDVIGVQYRHNKGRFRVAWVGEMNSPYSTQVGLEVVERGRDFWGLDGADLNAQDEYTPKAKPSPPQRSLGRMYAVEGVVEVREDDGKPAYWAQMTQIAERGGYVQAHTPHAAGSRVRLHINISNHEIAMNALVRSSQDAKGMSVEFTQPASVNDAVRLKSLIYGLESGIVRFDAPRPAEGTASFGERMGALSDQLRRLHDSITGSEVSEAICQEFQDAIAHLRHAAAMVQRSYDADHDEAATADALNSYRIQSMIRLCKGVGHEMRRSGMKNNNEELRELMQSVEDLFTLLAGLSFTVSEEAATEALDALPAIAAADDKSVERDDISLSAHLGHFQEHRFRKKRKS
jgi:hypothetical protein